MTDDDERISALFRDAASDAGAPPPAFGHDDVVSASRRITTRRRSAAVAAAAVIGLAGLGAAVLLPIGEDSLSSTASSPLEAPEAASAPYAADDAGSARAEQEAGAGQGSGGGEAASAPAPPAAPGLVPLGPGAGPCADRQDPTLRRLVEQALPEVQDAAPAATTDVCLSGRNRYLALQVPGGVLTVSYVAPGSIPAVVQGALLADTASGGSVIVHSTADPAGARAPFADRLPELVAFLAPRL